MSKYVIDSSTLTSIADAVRTKGGTTEPIVVSDIPAAIANIPSGGGGDLPEEVFTISGNCSYRFAYDGWNWFANKYANKITTKDITNASYMFYYCNLENILFELNFTLNKEIPIDSLFSNCHKLTTIPKINNCQPYSLKSLFSSCTRLRYLPDDIENWFDWSKIDVTTYPYNYSVSYMFNNCYSLRKIPLGMIRHVNRAITYNNSIYYYGFHGCFSLDEIINIPSYYNLNTWLNNAFNSTFNYCYRLKNITFAKQEDGTPYTVSWKKQTIDLSTTIGYASNTSDIINYNSGITADKEVKDDASYQLLKNDPDWFTTNVNYSRYNHDSAVATINSLPDTSAYLATAGGTNTIKFKGQAGALTDGGAINTLTEEEIAVAAAKGWTISLV